MVGRHEQSREGPAAVQAEAAAGNDAFSARLLTRLFGRPDAEFRDDLTFLLIGLNAP